MSYTPSPSSLFHSHSFSFTLTLPLLRPYYLSCRSHTLSASYSSALLSCCYPICFYIFLFNPRLESDTERWSDRWKWLCTLSWIVSLSCSTGQNKLGLQAFMYSGMSLWELQSKSSDLKEHFSFAKFHFQVMRFRFVCLLAGLCRKLYMKIPAHVGAWLNLEVRPAIYSLLLILIRVGWSLSQLY